MTLLSGQSWKPERQVSPLSWFTHVLPQLKGRRWYGKTVQEVRLLFSYNSQPFILIFMITACRCSKVPVTQYTSRPDLPTLFSTSTGILRWSSIQWNSLEMMSTTIGSFVKCNNVFQGDREHHDSGELTGVASQTAYGQSSSTGHGPGCILWGLGSPWGVLLGVFLGVPFWVSLRFIWMILQGIFLGFHWLFSGSSF